jgi:hypothetical protein
LRTRRFRANPEDRPTTHQVGYQTDHDYQQPSAASDALNGVGSHHRRPASLRPPTLCRRLPFLTLLLPTLVTGSPYDQQFTPHFGILHVRARVQSSIWCYPMTDFCLGIDDLLPVCGSAGHFAVLLYGPIDVDLFLLQRDCLFC